MRLRAALIALVVSGGVAVAAAPASAAQTAAVVTVDAGQDQGAFTNPAWFQNVSLLGEKDLARVHELHPRMGRSWANVASSYNEQTGESTFNDTTFDQAAQYSDRLLVNFGQCDQVLMTLSDPAACRAALEANILHRKQRVPGLQYVEFFNEPDKSWADAADPYLDVDTYYRWYRIGYSIVDELNARYKPAIPLRIGGPAAYEFDQPYLTAFLARYAADTDPGKRLDFVSFHEYQHQSNPLQVRTQKATVAGWLTAAGIDPATPVFVTEYGVFPGANSGTTPAADRLTQAAAMATLGGAYASGGMDMPMHWAYEHSNERKSMFVNADDGAVYPYYNVVRMQEMLKGHLAAATSSALTSSGIGVNPLATVDGSGVAVLTTNYQWTTGTDSHPVTMTVKNLPAGFANRSVHVQRYLIDAATSNYDADPAAAELTRVEDYLLPAGASAVPRPYTLGPNAIALVVLTPGAAEGEALRPVAPAGDTILNITDAGASGGYLSRYTPSAAGHTETFTLNAPIAGRYLVAGRIRETPTRGVVRPAVNGRPVGVPVDTSYAGYRFEGVDFGTVDLAPGATKLGFTVVAPGVGGGLEFGVDTLDLRPYTAYRVEAESRAPAGGPAYPLTYPGASGGGYLKADTAAAGDTFAFRVYAPEAGTFTLFAGLRYLPTRGICQFSVNGTPLGTPVDEYRATGADGFVALGDVQLAQPGPVTIGCTITGHSAGSTGYDYAVDYLELQKPG